MAPHQPSEASYLPSLQSSLFKTTSYAQELPAKASDLAFHRSVDPKLAAKLDATSGQVWNLIDSLLGLIAEDESGSKVGKRKRREEDDLIDDFEDTVVKEGVDGLLEKADTCMDNFLGRIPAPAIPIIPTETARSKNSTLNPIVSSNRKGRLPSSILNANIPKPQIGFMSSVANSNSLPTYKIYSALSTPEFAYHYGRFPLAHTYTPAELSTLPFPDVPPHPYTPSLLHPSFPASLLAAEKQESEPEQPASFEGTSFEYVETADRLNGLVDLLEKEAKEVAVDLEYHSLRTWGGFLCLMQLTARDRKGQIMGDYVVDLLVPEVREAVKKEMGRVLANSEIVKIFHGAESDIVWLQQNFDLFVVNLFDTYHATCVLEFPQHSLLSLLEKYCDYTPDKRYQLADWRIRPLPQEMLEYARSDTHYLIYIYDRLLGALLDNPIPPPPNPSTSSSFHTITGPLFTLEQTFEFPKSTPPSIAQVLTRSTQTALKRYAHDVYSSEGTGSQGYRSLAKKYNKLHLLPPLPVYASTETVLESVVFRKIHAWRDAVSREEDESTKYVLGNHLIFLLAERRPGNSKALFGLGQNWSEVVRRKVEDIVRIIKEGEEEGEKLAEELKKQAGTRVGQVVEGETGEDRERLLREEKDKEGRKTGVVLGIWETQSSVPKSSPTTTSQSSSLFGSSLKSSSRPTQSTSSVNAISSMFGQSLQSQKSSKLVAGSAPSNSSNAGFLEALRRIHSSINPPPPPPPRAVTPEDNSLPGVEQVPFVPASERLTTEVNSKDDSGSASAKVVDDDIVTVGKPKAKRRKTEQKTAVALAKEDVKGKGREGGDAMDVDEDEDEELEEKKKVEAFDYSSVPNGLDVVKGKGGAFGGKKIKKPKKEKKPIVEYGDFKKPPQSMAENKKGNRSKTFS
ncbi:Exosome 3'-5' exoribonuclease complex, subunit PM/SCL-100 (Rrp6) [Phaffia rhodozyma]|uniref:Exosome 3'-5' exoribonuclease complex, subunit PM/SCL-100 (Rrp6) n=1 Tax=Phaffia rhodozyma TaxID=264483 RepID=A0A0F7SGG9_PHARH|nr:Exosome 3'-5' exoribonuclease complex, subunit PM/SCL-100 (Rrp6) [Phaffia rhodozyma]